MRNYMEFCITQISYNRRFWKKKSQYLPFACKTPYLTRQVFEKLNRYYKLCIEAKKKYLKI